MRSKIEANEYKDYILGFIFYKYLSDQEIKFLKKMSLMTMILAILMKVTKRRLTISAKI
ncbi:type I restriction-modification system subunit M N-terminal domain-containing protein [Thomasclavelia spiroformis]|uniref:type I restriction-modification system subunit M N-terminal domain-containing protein n=1 Tax=Thomasclavelia spiroformis TaxID=29348 RepID=UPI003A172EFD